VKERAEVIKADKNVATLKIERKNECSGCKVCTFKNNANFVKVRAKNVVGAKKGDSVIVEMETDNRLTASFLVYIVPLIFAAIGLFIGYFLNSEIWMFALCVIMLIIGYIIIALIDKKLFYKKGFSPEIIKIILKEKKINE
jgi:sigma-E factor negative regulatory protein RseC